MVLLTSERERSYDESLSKPDWCHCTSARTHYSVSVNPIIGFSVRTGLSYLPLSPIRPASVCLDLSNWTCRISIGNDEHCTDGIDHIFSFLDPSFRSYPSQTDCGNYHFSNGNSSNRQIVERMGIVLVKKWHRSNEERNTKTKTKSESQKIENSSHWNMFVFAPI